MWFRRRNKALPENHEYVKSGTMAARAEPPGGGETCQLCGNLEDVHKKG